MKKFFNLLLILLAVSAMQAQQLPDQHFEDWSSEYNGDKQLKDWHGSNVSQVGLKFTFMYQETGRSGYCAYVANKEVGAVGITEVGPGYISLGTIWQYISGVNVSSATAGTDGGIKFTYRPDSISVWIKRTGPATDQEDFHILYYGWKGTAKGDKYKAKNGSCSSDSHTNEESDVRIALDHNECGTAQNATQVNEAWHRARATYNDWTQIKIPVYYLNDQVPEMCNVIFSSGNYPNYRANSGLNKGNAIYVDDIELIYSAKIQTLWIGDKEWKGFDPNSSEEQTYSLGESATTIPAIEAWRGAGQLTNAHNETVVFPGRKLTSKEITITKGEIDGAPTTIKVTSDDGKQTFTYKIKFVRAASTNTSLAGIQVSGSAIEGFRPTLTSYSYALPYGTKDAPIVTATAQEDKQVITIDQATSTTGTATIHVTAADGKSKKDYTISFSVALLSDNTLQGILVNDNPVAGFSPNLSIYKVSLPESTTQMPTVKAISAYPDGEQTITYTAPEQIDGGTYKISVTTPGNPTPKKYSLNFKLEASTYSYLASLAMGDYLTNFDPEQFIYYINLPLGTTELPQITFEKGDPYQTVTIAEGGLNGTTCVNVKAASGAMSVYKLVVSTTKSEYSLLNMIYLDGKPMEGFDKDITTYDYDLPIGTTTVPTITVDKGDEFEQVTILNGGLNGTTRISVSAQNGNTTIYQIAFSVITSSDASLRMIYVGGDSLSGFDPDVTDYIYPLPIGTTQVPMVTYDQGEYQTITVRDGGVNGDYKITVRPQTGASKTYKITFVVAQSSNTNLKSILIDNVPIVGFRADSLYYIDTLPAGISTIPTVTYVKAEESQKVLSVLDNTTQKITVTAENGDKKTYEVFFVIQKSENAYLKMIYLDSVPLVGFDSATLNYQVVLNTPLCPQITVDKADGQQVIITAPEAIGKAQIVVTPESGASNTYIVDFVAPAQTEVELNMIYVNGVAIEGYQPSNHLYTVHYEGNQPLVTYDTKDGQQVQELVDKDTVALHVTNGDKHGVYTIMCVRDLRSDATLKNILLDGVGLEDFVPSTLDYTVNLPAGSSLPVITFVKAYDSEITYFGQVAPNKFAIHVQAENMTSKVYTVTFARALYTDAKPHNIELSNGKLTYNPDKYFYDITLGSGETLPDVIITAKAGQTTMLYQVSDNDQMVQVTAEDGTLQSYSIHYERWKSDNCLLKTILLDGDTLDGFSPNKYEYVDTLAWRTRVIPNIQAVGQLPNQTITTYFCAIDGTAKIHVVAASGKTQDYFISFPVRKSSNTALKSVIIMEAEDFTYKPTQYDYLVWLPYGATAAPNLDFETQDEQHVEYIAAPLDGISQLIVMAEDGAKATYSFTFKVTPSSLKNDLKALLVNDNALDLSAGTDFEVELPYGSTEMNVAYTKRFPEQTVSMTQGGVVQPTRLTVYSNRLGEDSVVYTITPRVVRYNPAVLMGIMVDGKSIEGFEPDRYAYVASVTSVPTVTTSQAEGVSVTQKEKDNKHIVFTVKQGEYTNEYSVYFYFKNDQIPSNNFTDWSSTKYNGKQKPTGWMAPADCQESYSWTFLKVTTGQEVTALAGGGVHLSTWRDGDANAIYGSIPGIMTIGTLSMSLASSGNSTSSVSGGITYRNTPDQIYCEYNPITASNIDNWRLWVELSDGTKSVQTPYYGSYGTKNKWQVMTKDLDYSGLGLIQKMNLTVNSAHSDNAKDLGGATKRTADLYVRNLRFLFNSVITSATIDGKAATISGTKITYKIADAEYSKFPKLKIVGQKADQSPVVVWSDEVKGVRTASIRNYAEDGSYTTYDLEITRTLSSLNTLSQIEVNGIGLPHFDANVTEYDYEIENGTTTMPDVSAKPKGCHAQLTIRYEGTNAIVEVQPETGKVKTYIIHFVEKKSSSTQLAYIDATGISFDPSQRDYYLTSKTLPTIKSFTKESDGQTVDWKGGNFVVTAEDGLTQGVYRLIPDATTSAQITNFVLDGVDVQGFGGTSYEITHVRPTLTAFVRTDDKDSVVYVQTDSLMKWEVYGAQSVQHTYTLTYPTTLSDNATLKAILVSGETIENFNPQIFEYTIYSDTALALQVIGAEDKQKIAITSAMGEGLTYTIVVTAANGVAKKTYSIKVVPVLLDIATLDGIYLDGQLIEGFHKDTFTYEVTLPTPSVKVVEPQMPALTYKVTDSKEAVSIELGALNSLPTFLSVRSGSGKAEKSYTVKVNTEPSHNADLTGIVVNGMPVDRFEKGRHYYSAAVEDENIVITWSSEDHFQNVTLLKGEGSEYTIHVVAQDGVTTQDYIVDVYMASLSNDVTLRNILLDGMEFSDFQRALNEKLEFSSMKNQYDINLPSGTTVLPEVSATMQMDGQKVDIRHEGLNIYLDVTAKDGVSKNTYTLNFHVPLSSNANLSMIFCNGDSIKDFMPDYYYYLVTLPVGTHTLPEIVAQKGQANQTIAEPVIEEEKSRVTIYVTAEDGKSTSAYVIVFEFERSHADTLEMIYASGDTLPGFDPQRFVYSYELPVGTTAFPAIEYVAADQWQTIRMDTIAHSDEQITQQIYVQSEFGNSKTYTVDYKILPSKIDTLMMIDINGTPLPGFDSHVQEYYFTLENTATELPKVGATKGDPYQTISTYQLEEVSEQELPDSVKAVNQKVEIHVQAQDGHSRIYNVHFSMKKSQDSLLNMIMLKGKNLSGFASEVTYYNDKALALNCQESVPVVTVVKKHEAQKVEISVKTVEDAPDTVYIDVTAEDGKHKETYTIIFADQVSDNCFLSNLLFSDGYYVPFDSLQQEYTLHIPYGVDTIPSVLPIQSDVCQKVVIGDPVKTEPTVVQQTITVYPYNNTISYQYTITYLFHAKGDALAEAIYLRSELLKDFDKDQFEYVVEYEEGTKPEQMCLASEVTVVLSDPNASYVVRQDENMTLYIDVTAQDPTVSNTYMIEQVIGLSKNNYLSAILLDGELIRDFDTDVTFYTYYVLEGGAAPKVSAMAFSDKADVSIKNMPVGDTTVVTCIAENGDVRKYYILFTNTTIQSSLSAKSEDVLIKRVEGYNIFIATIRHDVDFGIYDQIGHLVQYEKNMKVCDQNNAVIQTYANGKEVLTDVLDLDQGITIELIPNQIYFYAFYSPNGTIVRGKLMLRP